MEVSKGDVVFSPAQDMASLDSLSVENHNFFFDSSRGVLYFRLVRSEDSREILYSEDPEDTKETIRIKLTNMAQLKDISTNCMARCDAPKIMEFLLNIKHTLGPATSTLSLLGTTVLQSQHSLQKRRILMLQIL